MCIAIYKLTIMDRNAIYRVYNSQMAIYDKADELGVRKQLSGYSQMTPAQRRAVSPQVSRLAESLGLESRYCENVYATPVFGF